jgi:hypothetical protein
MVGNTTTASSAPSPAQPFREIVDTLHAPASSTPATSVT